jgi:uncharacterized protein YjiS (DUF1127 family)
MTLLKKIYTLPYRYWKYLMTWQMHRDTIKHLNRLSNRDLRDIGLTRGDINNLVWMKKDFEEQGKDD